MMKTKQAFLTITLLLTLLYTACSQQYNSPNDFETRQVVVDGKQGIRITSYKGKKTDVRIPPRINNLPVLVLGGNEEEFDEKTIANYGDAPTDFSFLNKQLTSVTIPDGVIAIEFMAFAGNQLTSVTIPNSVTTIGYQAFAGNRLTSITIPNSVSVIVAGAFESNQLTSVAIPDSVTIINGSTFEDNRLTSVVIPDSVTQIDYDAFRNNRLTSVVIPDSVVFISLGAFENNRLTSVTIPAHARGIGRRAFKNNQLTNVTIPNGVNIETEAFFDNPVTNITFPFGAAALESIDGAFNNYDALESLGIIIDQDNVADSRFREVPLPGLQICYSVNGRKAGTYTWDGKTEQWSKTK